MAHNDWPLLQKLVSLLDDSRFDFFIHIDIKSKGFDNSMISSVVKKSHVFYLTPRSVFWADYSQSQTELDLLQLAKATDTYSYYHLLSGADLPIKSNDEIYEFFEKSQKNFLGIVPREFYYCIRRVKYYHPFLHNSIYRKCKPLKALDRVLEYIQRFIGINRLRGREWKIINGWNWFSITQDFCQYVLFMRTTIDKVFSFSIASDELFMQTLAYNSPYYDTLYDTTNLCRGSMREIDWHRGSPYNWGGHISDYEYLMSSQCMFARKFSTDQKEIVELIYQNIRNQNLLSGR